MQAAKIETFKDAEGWWYFYCLPDHSAQSDPYGPFEDRVEAEEEAKLSAEWLDSADADRSAF